MIARNLGTSGYHVAGLARRLGLPLPGNGHWMKAEAGKTPPTPLYPADDRLDEGDHQLARPVRRTAPAVSAARSRPTQAADRDPAGAGQVSSDAKPPPSAPAQPAAPVPEPAPHPKVAQTRAALRRAAPQDRTRCSGPGRFRLLLSAGQAERACNILDDLIRVAEDRGWEITDTKDGLAFAPDGEVIGFLIEEKLEALPHTATAAELREKAHYDRQCALAARGIGHRPWREPAIPAHDYVPNGQLVLQFDRNYGYGGHRRTFSDGKRQRLEQMVGAIADSFAACAAGVRARREEQERWHREYQALEAERRRLENLARVEGYRIAFLRKQIERHREIGELDALIAGWETAPPAGEDFQALVAFARNWRDRQAATLAPDAVAARLSKLRLMSDDIHIFDLKNID